MPPTARRAATSEGFAPPLTHPPPKGGLRPLIVWVGVFARAPPQPSKGVVVPVHADTGTPQQRHVDPQWTPRRTHAPSAMGRPGCVERWPFALRGACALSVCGRFVPEGILGPAVSPFPFIPISDLLPRCFFPRPVCFVEGVADQRIRRCSIVVCREGTNGAPSCSILKRAPIKPETGPDGFGSIYWVTSPKYSLHFPLWGLHPWLAGSVRSINWLSGGKCCGWCGNIVRLATQCCT